MKFLLDTNVLSETSRRAPDAAVLEWLEGLAEVAVSAITVEELEYGVGRSEGNRLRQWLDAFIDGRPVIIPVDEQIATLAGRLRAKRIAAGFQAAQADMLIAASAATTGRVLVTRNTRDFEGCGLTLLNPFPKPAPGPVTK